MRNPNGYGSVYKLSGTRRNPWTARVTVGFKIIEDKKSVYPIYKFLGYFATRSEAMRALALYNGEELTSRQEPTLSEVYEGWAREKFPTLKETAHYQAAFKVVAPLHSKKLSNLTIRDFEDCFTASGKNKPTLSNTKILLKAIYSFAYRKGYIDDHQANLPSFIQFISAADGKSESPHKSFTHSEVDKLWKHSDDEIVRIVLFMIYSGVRISELMNLKSEDVNIERQFFKIRDSKTNAGIRTVPIADKVLDIAKSYKAQNMPYFVPLFNTIRTTQSFRSAYFAPTLSGILKDKHSPHDTRYTTISYLTEAKADIRHIKLICGHAQGDVTNDVYARKIDISFLLETINLIP